MTYPPTLTYIRQVIVVTSVSKTGRKEDDVDRDLIVRRLYLGILLLCNCPTISVYAMRISFSGDILQLT